MKKRNITKSAYNNNFKVVIYSVMAITFISALVCFFLAFSSSSDKLLYNYSINRNADYKVILYDNDYTTETSMAKNQTYITSLTKSINSDFSYKLVTSKKLNLKYVYDIKASVKADYKNSNDSLGQIFNKEYVLLDATEKEINDANRISINENVDIDFAGYNKEVTDFKTNLKLSINAYVDVVMNVKVFDTSDSEGANIIDESSISISVPLDKQAFSITENYTPSDSKDVYKEANSKINLNLLYLAILLVTITVFIYILSYGKLARDKKLKSQYRADLNKILKTYGDVIVEIVNPVKTRLSGVIDVKNFNEMMDLEQELRVPILFYEIPGRNEGWFTIIHNEILYRFVLKDDKSEWQENKRRKNS